MNELIRRLRPGEKERTRYVSALYPEVKVELTSDEIEEYRRVRPFAFAYDRQSVAGILKTREKVGHEMRVRNILHLAACGPRRLYLPEPMERRERREGEAQCELQSRFWFVDGVERNATGFTGHPHARPEVWRLAKTVAILAEHGCPPEAVLIGEPTRFFRDREQFVKWYRILTAKGTKLVVFGVGADLAAAWAYVSSHHEEIEHQIKENEKA